MEKKCIYFRVFYNKKDVFQIDIKYDSHLFIQEHILRILMILLYIVIEGLI